MEFLGQSLSFSRGKASYLLNENLACRQWMSVSLFPSSRGSLVLLCAPVKAAVGVVDVYVTAVVTGNF